MSKKFVGGGLLVDEALMCSGEVLATPADFAVPEWVDSRPLCLASSNQGSESSCAGFATAGFIEVAEWARSGVQKQIDGSAIYKQAKTFDGSPQDGTTLTAAVRAAKDLNLLPMGQEVRVIKTRRDLQFALHRNRVCIVGFAITDDWNAVNPLGFIGEKGAKSLGGHAVLACYYDGKSVGWQNSWGEAWGVRGFGRMTWEQFDKQFMYGVTF